MVTAGIDIGYSNLKVVTGNFNTGPRVMVRPGGACPLENVAQAIREDRNPPYIRVSLREQPWAAAMDPEHCQHWERELSKDFPFSDPYLALYYAALLQTGETRLDRVITGLPVNQYLNTKLRRSLVERLQGRHQVHDQQCVDVGEVIVLPQPVGAYLDLVRSGMHLDLIEQGRVVVIDPGFFSVDWVALERGAIRHASSGTSLEAVSRVLELAAAELSRDYDINTGINRLERALREQRHRALLCGQKIDIRPALGTAATKAAGETMKLLQRNLRSLDIQADLILLTGGGATLFYPAVREAFPNLTIHVPIEPVAANALGFWYFGV
jgi:plasmid segregation protein ParM